MKQAKAMKKIKLLILITIIFSHINSSAQEENRSKFSIIGNGGFGYGIIENDSEPNYNMNSDNGEILLNYKINQIVGISTGIGINNLSGNGFNSVGNFYHERTLLKVPLLITMDIKKSLENFRIFVNLGFYGQNIIKDEYRFLNTTQKEVFDGWNFGAQIGIGFVFDMFWNMSAGINLNGQSDFSKFESNNNAGINDKQKMKDLSSIGIVLIIKLLKTLHNNVCN